MPQTQRFEIDIGADYACFARPEFKVERVSYPVMTPSAARGALEAVFWKPEVRWEVRRIDVLAPIRETTILRNEVSDQQSTRGGLFVVEKKRQQRSSLVLKAPAYRIHADLMLEAHASAPIPKYASQVQRRIDRGQCFHRPYLGNREFPAWFEPTSSDRSPIDDNRSIGTMLFEIAYVESQERKELTFARHDSQGRRKVSGYAEPIFFDAALDEGTLDVPDDLYQTLHQLEGR